MIEGYIGLPGAGKTLSMTTRAFKSRKRYAEIISNYSLDAKRFAPARLIRFNEASDLLEKLEHCLNNRDGKQRLVLLDEVHLIFDARAWSKVPPEFLRILAQPRKASLDMLYTAQHESQVEKRLRTVTNYLWLCKSWDLIPGVPGFFWADQFDAFQFRMPRAERFQRRIYRLDKRYHSLYDTMEVLDRANIDQAGTQGWVASTPSP